MEEKKPLETKITKDIEVEPSFEIQIQKQKNILNLIWHWHVTAPPMFPPVREFIFIPSMYLLQRNNIRYILYYMGSSIKWTSIPMNVIPGFF